MSLNGPVYIDLRQIDPIELFHLCAAERENEDAWSEFLSRYMTKLKYFVHGALRQVFGRSTCHDPSTASDGLQESDLLQNSIVRLVENDCAAMKRFSGTSENDLLAYLAVICRSSVLDTLRHNNAQKRKPPATENEESIIASIRNFRPANHTGFEREILAHELAALSLQTIQAHSRSDDVSNRDRLVFKLHFFDGLSCSQIARCGGINLSKAGVEKLLKRLVGQVQTLASSGKSEETQQ
jgi:RNA polymerase sigma factor (sigma-70 family)